MIYITPRVIPSGHCQCAVVSLDERWNDFCDFSDLTSPFHHQDFSDFTDAWNLPVTTIYELLAHPDIIHFSPETHPEYFL